MVIRELITRLGYSIDQKKLTEYQEQTKNVSEGMMKIGRRGMMFVTAPLALAAGLMVKSRSDIENIETNLGTLLQSEEKALEMITEINEFSKVTPFKPGNIAPMAETLLGFNIAGEKVVDTLRMLGDASLGNQNRFETLTRVYGKVMSQGKLTGETLEQMINARFNIMIPLAEMTGKTFDELRADMAKGAISAEMFDAAFRRATSAGGQFFEGMKRGSQTTAGLWSTFLGNIEMALANFGKKLEVVTKPVLNWLIEVSAALVEIDGPTQGFLLGLGALVAIIPAAIFGLGNLLFAVNNISVGFTMLSAAAAKANITVGLLVAKIILIPALIIGAMALLYLIIEDIVGFFKGKESITGDLIDAISAFGSHLWDKFKTGIDMGVIYIKEAAGFLFELLTFNFFGLFRRFKRWKDGFFKASDEMEQKSFIGNFNAQSFVPSSADYKMAESLGLLGSGRHLQGMTPVAVGGGGNTGISVSGDIVIQSVNGGNTPELQDDLARQIKNATFERGQK